MSPREERAKLIIGRWMERAAEGLTCHPVSSKDAEAVQEFCEKKGRTVRELLDKLVSLGAAPGPDSMVMPGFASRKTGPRALASVALPPVPPPQLEQGLQISFMI